MSRVLLFVQAGNERPKFLARIGIAGPLPPGLTVNVFPGLTCNKQERFGDADRWWLVECENADSGRNLILASLAASAAHRDVVADLAMKHHIGRILASGGRP